MNTLKNKSTLTSIALLMVALLFLVFEGQFLVGRVRLVYDKYQLQKEENAKLSERVGFLQQIDGESVTAISQDSTVALPPTNPAILVASHVRTFATDLNLIIDRLTMSPTSVEGVLLSQLDVEIELVGSRSSVFEYVKSFESVAPIVQLVSVNIDSSTQQTGGDLVVAHASIRAYWLPFPPQLPIIPEGGVSLTPAETQLLSQLSQLKKPSFLGGSSVTVPIEPKEGRIDPFSL